MKIDHIAIWTNNLEQLKNYYIQFFDGTSNQKYFNPKTQFESYFISFETGCRLELMTNPDIETRDNHKSDYGGITHLAFEVDTKAGVDLKFKEIEAAGFSILKQPRTTGDGYYEFVTADIDGNIIEITTKEQ